jgi:hypothetical protein
MTQWIKMTGKLVYDPVRPDLKKTHKQRTLIIQPRHDELDLYYQWFLKKRYGLMLQRPMWRTHVTVVAGNEHLPNEASWKKHEGKYVEFLYSPELEKHWQFWVLPVSGEGLMDMREELGLKSKFSFHITIGRLYD